ncbi:hypothetical protein V6N11_063363 [Hibiscus sabdariffa]|uniref:Uncharacterized protein n=1 Tax=Hibiscus sabdariffa TaxID=183260 RepID=A0ABR1ZAD1_9ROSI
MNIWLWEDPSISFPSSDGSRGSNISGSGNLAHLAPFQAPSSLLINGHPLLNSSFDTEMGLESEDSTIANVDGLKRQRTNSTLSSGVSDNSDSSEATLSESTGLAKEQARRAQ